MFTGIVQAVGKVRRMEPSARGVRLEVEASGWAHRARLGDSVSVSGVCLTVAAEPGAFLSFDVVSETLAKTTLGALRAGDGVNLEPSVRADGLLDGHLVQGHIEGVAEVTSATHDPRDWRVEIRPPAELMECIVPKGAIAVDGVSLTVASATKERFEVALIPTTLERTTLGALRAGSRCNIETDVVARTVVRWMKLYGVGGARG